MKLISYFHDIIGDKLLLNFGVRFQRLYKLQNSPYFCVFKYVRTVKQKFWRFFFSRLTWACEAHDLGARKTFMLHFTDFFTDFEKKTDCFAV